MKLKTLKFEIDDPTEKHHSESSLLFSDRFSHSSRFSLASICSFPPHHKLSLYISSSSAAGSALATRRLGSLPC